MKNVECLELLSKSKELDKTNLNLLNLNIIE